MSTSEAEEAVGLAMHKRLTGATLDAWWNNMTPDQRAPYIEDGMSIVAAYDAARWREPTELDLRDHENPR